MPEPHDAEASRVGEILCGRYRLEERLGSGAMGDVYRAVNTAVGRTVALKILRPDVIDNPEVVERFLQEGKVAYLVRHPHVVEVLDVDRDEAGVPFIVLEFLNGEDLAAYVEYRGGSLPVADVLDLMIPAVEAVGSAHVKGLVHRDIKPENIFLVRDKGELVPKVVDFGVSKVLDHEGFKKTMTGIVVGTPPYMSPEQIQRPLAVDARTDVWAFGVMLYEIVTGTLPFDGSTVAQLFTNICIEPIRPVTTMEVWCPASLADVIQRCLEKSPADRYETCMELADELAAVRREVASATTPDPAESQRARLGTMTESERTSAGWGDLDLPTSSSPARPGHPSRLRAPQPSVPTGVGAGPSLELDLAPTSSIPARRSSGPAEPPRPRDKPISLMPLGPPRPSGARFGAASTSASASIDVDESVRRPAPYRPHVGGTVAGASALPGAPSIVDTLVAAGLMAAIVAFVPRLDPATAAAALPSPLSMELVGGGVLATLVLGAIAWAVFHGGGERESTGLRVAGAALATLTICLAMTIVVLALPRVPIRASVEMFVPMTARLSAAAAAFGFGGFGLVHARDALTGAAPRHAQGALLAALSVGGLVAGLALAYAALSVLL